MYIKPPDYVDFIHPEERQDVIQKVEERLKLHATISRSRFLLCNELIIDSMSRRLQEISQVKDEHIKTSCRKGILELKPSQNLLVMIFLEVQQHFLRFIRQCLTLHRVS